MPETFAPEVVARSLAAAHPKAMLPCPVCAASLKASNLDKHLGKVHSGVVAEGRRWSGSDRALMRPLVALFFVTVLQLPLLTVVPVAFEQLALLAIAAQMTVFLGGLGLTLFGKLPAELSLEGNRLVVRYGLGLLSRSVTLPPEKVAVGVLLEEVPRTHVPGYPDWATDDVKAGTYLRLRGTGMLTLGTKTGTGLRGHWDPAGWSSGGKVKWWDITLDASALVAVEYMLAERGLLVPRSEPGA